MKTMCMIFFIDCLQIKIARVFFLVSNQHELMPLIKTWSRQPYVNQRLTGTNECTLKITKLDCPIARNLITLPVLSGLLTSYQLKLRFKKKDPSQFISYQFNIHKSSSMAVMFRLKSLKMIRRFIEISYF
jgi:hypothetical protein